eukprot:TRINITY_DN5413_c0_g1_i2.p1 TRINITY_DN5413_c0_g1~~TRINITY_DN5413_c0_g1_i2.p1  ORF type:complete len:155 (-),score=3.97 TRINITY_DN5413_c0_g1_i2:150-614(-)
MYLCRLCFILVPLHGGHGSRPSLPENLSDTARTPNVADGNSTLKERRESQKAVDQANESHANWSVLPRSRQSHEREQSFADLRTRTRPNHERVQSLADLTSNSSGGSSEQTERDNESLESLGPIPKRGITMTYVVIGSMVVLCGCAGIYVMSSG